MSLLIYLYISRLIVYSSPLLPAFQTKLPWVYYCFKSIYLIDTKDVIHYKFITNSHFCSIKLANCFIVANATIINQLISCICCRLVNKWTDWLCIQTAEILRESKLYWQVYKQRRTNNNLTYLLRAGPVLRCDPLGP